MMQVIIDTEGDALHDNPAEVSRILRGIADRVDRGESGQWVTILDINGNTVGRWKLGPDYWEVQ